MSDLATVTFLAGRLIGLAIGFMAGALWQARVHIADLKSHIRSTEEYSASVAKLLDDMAMAVIARREDEA